MNAFVEHHKDNIQFGYRCFDRLLLNGLIQPFQQPERVPGFAARLSTGLPRACSGDMYAAAPRIMPAWVMASESVGDMVGFVEAPDGLSSPALASPKSSSFTTPPGVILILAGFRSRCTMPFSWAASSSRCVTFNTIKSRSTRTGLSRRVVGRALLPQCASR